MHLNKRRNVPLYWQLAHIIRERIVGQQYRAGEYIPSERELTLEFGVDRSTVRRAIDLLVREGLLERRAGAGSLVKGAPDAASSDYKGLDLVTLVIPNSPGFYLFAPLMRVCERESYQHGFHLISCTTQNDAAVEAQHLQRLIERRIRGILLWYVGGEANLPLIRQILEQKIPLVLLDRYIEGLPTDYVGVDNVLGGRLATEHLINLGHTRIAHITSPTNVSAVKERAAGYEAALRAHSLRVNEDYIRCSAESVEVSGYECMRSLLTLPEPPTAVFAANDLIAYSALRALGEAGRRVPADIALVGFDDVEEMSLLKVPLTSVRQPFEEIGRAATQLLLKRIAEGVEASTQRIVLQPALVVRASCGAQASAASGPSLTESPDALRVVAPLVPRAK